MVPLIHSTPLLNILPNWTSLRGPYDMFDMPPSFEVLVHHANIKWSSMSNTDISSVLIWYWYYLSKGKKYPRVGNVCQDTKNIVWQCICICTEQCLGGSDRNIFSKIHIWMPSVRYSSLPKVVYDTLNFTCCCNECVTRFDTTIRVIWIWIMKLDSVIH